MIKKFNLTLNLPEIECDKEIDRLFNDATHYRVGEVANRIGGPVGKNLLYRFLRKINILNNNNSVTAFARELNLASDDTYYIPEIMIQSNVPRLSIHGIKYMWSVASKSENFIPAFLWTWMQNENER